ncbi:FAD-dependent monooxygenase [Legionella brunensis]|uniref:NAD dependent epimerase/dehydratase n=1 Tax=Legionella brunensis TaxID=29422 RepID=A0A0W0SP18_9GAMM|nr:FAD-dependent monooxygenase [Legionella brunensis]KTC85004.1 NAD dependent epimerase/dehydratase [Legionella brunensis]
MPSKSIDILIIGGGIGGLTTAIACHQVGFSTLILERSPHFSEIGAGIWIPPNAMQIFKMLNISEGFSELGYPIKKIKLATTHSGKLKEMSFRRYKFNILAIHRAKLQEFLAQHIQENSILFDTNISGIHQNDAEVTVQLTTGEILKTKILVGADGLHSQVRHVMSHENGIRYSGSTSFRGIAKLDTNTNNMGNTSYEIWAPGCRLGFSLISAQEVYWYLTFATRPQNYFSQEEIFSLALSLVRKHFPQHINIIHCTKPQHIIQTDISDLKPLKHWSKNRIGLLGDAAHATRPNLGQGAGQAIEDAMALSLSLKKHGLEAKALEAYHAIRYKKTRFIVNQARFLGKMCHWSLPVLQSIRDFAIRNTPKFIEQKMMDKIYRPVIE